MSWLDRLERKFGRYGLPHVTEALIGGQVLLIGVALADPEALQRILLSAEGLGRGEYYRLVTFLLVPPSGNIIFAFFAWYIFYLFGTALEQTWGAFRYNVFLLIGYLATVAAALLMPVVGGGSGVMDNYFIGASVFLAFAYLYPNFEILLFLVWPVKVKWLALLSGFFMAGAVLAGPIPAKLAALAAVANFLIFFTPDIFRRLRGARRQSVRRMEAAAQAEQAMHCCRECGATEKTNPELEFRYCGSCAGAPCFCEHHIFNHEHVTSADPAAGAEQER